MRCDLKLWDVVYGGGVADGSVAYRMFLGGDTIYLNFCTNWRRLKEELQFNKYSYLVANQRWRGTKRF